MSRKMTSREAEPRRETTAQLSSPCLLFVKQLIKGSSGFAERLLYKDVGIGLEIALVRKEGATTPRWKEGGNLQHLDAKAKNI